MDAEKATPEWWLEYLLGKLNADVPKSRQDKNPAAHRSMAKRLDRFTVLWSYYVGQPPLPSVAAEYQEPFREVMRKARANYAQMAVDALTDRLTLHGCATSLDADADGDSTVARILSASGFAALHRDMQTWKGALSEAYVVILPPREGQELPFIEAVDPRKCVGVVDPWRKNRHLAALQVGYDELKGRQTARLFVPGYLYLFEKDSQDEEFKAGEWEQVEVVALPDITDVGGVPVVRFANKMDLGEYEPHLDLLDRIIETILQRVVTARYQSFRQRAIIGDFDDEGDDPDAPSLGDVFSADPGALWKAPAGTQFWEAQQADLRQILEAVRDDVKEFAAVTRTPLHLITPDAAQGSAEGASLMRESLEDKALDRKARDEPGWEMVFRIALAFAGQRPEWLRLLWAPIQRNSLGEKSSATSQTRGILSRRRVLTNVWEMSPQEVKLNEDELLEENLLLGEMMPEPEVDAEA